MAEQKKRVVKRRISGSAGEGSSRSYVPPTSVYKSYVGREIFGVWDAEIAKYAMGEGVNILLMGDTGSGKTKFGEAFASWMKAPYYSLSCDVSVDPSSYFGRMQPTDEAGKFVWQDGPVTEIVRGPCGLSEKCKDPKCIAGVLNFSEINFTPPKIAASLYPLLDDRRYIPLLGHSGEVVRAHHNLLIIADMNPSYRGTFELNDAFMNRFEIKINWGYLNSVEKKLVKSNKLLNMAQSLRLSEEIETPVSTNALMEFEKFFTNDKLGPEFAKNNFISTFNEDERGSVERLLELCFSKISSELGKSLDNGKSEEIQDIEDIEFTVEG